MSNKYSRSIETKKDDIKQFLGELENAVKSDVKFTDPKGEKIQGKMGDIISIYYGMGAVLEQIKKDKIDGKTDNQEIRNGIELFIESVKDILKIY